MFKVAYVLQQSVDLRSPTGTPLHIQGVLQAARHVSDEVALFGIRGRDVYKMNIPEGLNLATHFAAQEISSCRDVMAPVERPVRRLQTIFNSPYFCFFDTARMATLPQEHFVPYNVLHTHFDIVPMGAALLSKRLGLPMIVDAEADWFDEMEGDGIPVNRAFKRWAQFAQQDCLNRAAAITVVSSELKKHFVENWQLSESKIHVLPNGVDTEKFDPARNSQSISHWRQRFHIGENEKAILFVGGFYRRHGLDLLARAFRLVSDNHPNSKLLLVGNGSTLPHVQQLVHDLGLDSSVCFAGEVPHDAIPEILQLADITVSPADEQYITGEVKPLLTSPLKLLEYMAAGTACVATATGQQTQVIEHLETGMLVPPDDEFAFAQAITYLIEHEQEASRIGANARRYVLANHSWAHYGSHLRDIYAETMAASQSQPAQ